MKGKKRNRGDNNNDVEKKGDISSFSPFFFFFFSFLSFFLYIFLEWLFCSFKEIR